MGARSIEAKEYTCDGCGKSRIAFGDKLPNGYHGGETTRVTNSETVIVRGWYACQSRCIGKAIESQTSEVPAPMPLVTNDDDKGVPMPIPEPEGGLTDDGTPVKANNPAWS